MSSTEPLALVWLVVSHIFSQPAIPCHCSTAAKRTLSSATVMHPTQRTCMCAVPLLIMRSYTGQSPHSCVELVLVATVSWQSLPPLLNMALSSAGYKKGDQQLSPMWYQLWYRRFVIWSAAIQTRETWVLILHLICAIVELICFVELICSKQIESSCSGVCVHAHAQVLGFEKRINRNICINMQWVFNFTIICVSLVPFPLYGPTVETIFPWFTLQLV